MLGGFGVKGLVLKVEGLWGERSLVHRRGMLAAPKLNAPKLVLQVR